MELRLAAIFLVGICLGSLVNLAVYRLAWHPRAIGPWTPRDPRAARRKLFDCVPVFGWLGLRREAVVHGRGYWIRPLLVELGLGAALAALYWWEVGQQGLLPPAARANALAAALHVPYLAQSLLITLMLAASLIDLDEKIIPDTITVPGTLLGLMLAALCPWITLPVAERGFTFLQLTTPRAWPAWLDGPDTTALAIALGCFCLWCLALLPRPWRGRHGVRRAWQLLVARLVRERVTYLILGMAVVGSVAIAAVWNVGGIHWDGLLTALVGLAASGGTVWLVRIIGQVTLGREAMGFGDVTLMAMIGAFLGWQPCLIIFFLAPFAGLFLGIAQVLVGGDHEIPYGPFLCLATVVTIVAWEPIWARMAGVFALGWIVPGILAACLVLMAVLLLLLRGIKRALGIGG